MKPFPTISAKTSPRKTKKPGTIPFGQRHLFTNLLIKRFWRSSSTGWQTSCKDGWSSSCLMKPLPTISAQTTLQDMTTSQAQLQFLRKTRVCCRQPSSEPPSDGCFLKNISHLTAYWCHLGQQLPDSSKTITSFLFISKVAHNVEIISWLFEPNWAIFGLDTLTWLEAG